MKNTDGGFAIVVALLVVAAMSAVAATAFFISVSDLQISFNRLQGSKALRDAERVLAEAEMEIENCLRGNGVGKCAGEVEDSVSGVTNAVSESDAAIFLSVVGRAGNFSTEVGAGFSVQNGKIKINSWRQKVEEGE